MSQKDQILNHLKRNREITPIDALKAFGCFRLAARIRDLRDDGYNIHTEMVKHGEKQWARYSLISSPK